MHRYRIYYHNSQGTLLRILLAATRRGLDLFYVQAEPAGERYQVTLVLEAPPKQMLQLGRDWRATVDVVEVEEPVPIASLEEALATGLLSAGATAAASLAAAN